jgi:ankyrin repeat protein
LKEKERECNISVIKMDRDWFECVRQNEIDTVEIILDTCKWIKVNDFNRFGETALHIASSKGHVETIQLLLQHGSNLFALDEVKSHRIY